MIKSGFLNCFIEMILKPNEIFSKTICALISRHNAEVGGVPNSQHVEGTAADIYTDDLTVDELADAAIEVGFDGIGRYYGDQFVHVDCRDDGCSPNEYTWEG